MELMDRALDSSTCLSPSKAQALEYRDGLIIALLALIPLRRRTLATLRIGKHVVAASYADEQVRRRTYYREPRSVRGAEPSILQKMGDDKPRTTTEQRKLILISVVGKLSLC
jgi:hypothetical protein